MKLIRIIIVLGAFVTSFALTGSLPLLGQGPAPKLVVDVWPESKMPGRGAAEPERDQPTRPDGIQRITNISRPTLAVYPAASKQAPAILISPGGGYTNVVPGKEGYEVAAWLNSIGVTALVLKYRVPNNREGALQDIQRAIRLAHENAKAWNIDRKRLGVMGFSAGGHLSAKASMLFGTSSYAAIDKVDRHKTRPDFAVLVYPAYLEKDGLVSTDANLPPTLILGTVDDKTYFVSSKAYHEALDAAKLPNKLIVYHTGGHGYGMRATGEAQAWTNDTEKWLREMRILK